MNPNGDKARGLARWQAAYITAAAFLLPVSPLLYLQGQYTRRKIGLLPDAGGERSGSAGAGEPAAKLLVIGESTVAGLGARTHKEAMAGQFALRLAARTGRMIEWDVIGRNGVTARRTIDELVPQIPDRRFDYILLGIGGNDVLKLSSPKKWRRDMLELIAVMRRLSPDAVIFISNCPMIKYSPALPQPIKFLLWELSKLHDRNIRAFTAGADRVYYYPQPHSLNVETFFSDGIHPSESGYAEWAEAMIEYFGTKVSW